MHGQQPVRRAVENPRRPTHRARRSLTDLRKCVLGGAPRLDAQVEQRLEALRGIETCRVATLHVGRQRSKGVLPEQCSHGLPLGWNQQAIYADVIAISVPHLTILVNSRPTLWRNSADSGQTVVKLRRGPPADLAID